VITFREVPPPNFQGERANPEMRDWVVSCTGFDEGVTQDYPKKGIEGKPTRFPLASVLECEKPDLLLENPGVVQFEGKMSASSWEPIFTTPTCAPFTVTTDLPKW